MRPDDFGTGDYRDPATTDAHRIDPAIVEMAAKVRYESGARRAGTDETWEMSQPLIREWETESMEAALEAVAPAIAAKALRDAASEVYGDERAKGPHSEPLSIASWLRTRADALAPSGRTGECPETGLHRELCAHCDDLPDRENLT